MVLRHKKGCVPDVDDLRELIMDKAHGSLYLILRGATNIYCDLRDIYRWNGMKKGHYGFCL